MDVSVGVFVGEAVILGVLDDSGVPVSVDVAVSVAVIVAVVDPVGVIVADDVEVVNSVAVGVASTDVVGVAVAQNSPGSTMGSRESPPGPGYSASRRISSTISGLTGFSTIKGQGR